MTDTHTLILLSTTRTLPIARKTQARHLHQAKARLYFVTQVLLNSILPYKNNRPRQRWSLEPDMRSSLLAIGCLAATFSLPALANGQDALADSNVAEQLLWSQVYSQGGTTLYCGTAFSGEGGQFEASLIYSSKQIKSVLDCVTTRQCAIIAPSYRYMMSDLHNIYPALTRVELARRNAQFGELDGNVPSAFADIGCDMKTSFRLVEPRDQAKGNVARALFYMSIEYDLPIGNQVQLYKKWHQMDPPDAEEMARNNKIASLQGTRNRFIDNPELVEKLIKN
jgi:deoxyribonuclease-1